MWCLQQLSNDSWDTIDAGSYETCVRCLFDLWYDSPEGVDYLDLFRIVNVTGPVDIHGPYPLKLENITIVEEVSGDKLYNAIACIK